MGEKGGRKKEKSRQWRKREGTKNQGKVVAGI
jgi:hypothetical protein